MALTIKKVGENKYVRALIQNVADVPGGVTISSADLIPGTIIEEGAYVSAPDNSGLCHIIKTAKVYETAGSTSTTYKVYKGHQFKVGDFITKAANSAAYAITAIDQSEANYDTITVGTTITGVSANATIVKSTNSGASSTLATVLGRLVESYNVVANDNIFAPVCVIGTYKQAIVPPTLAALDAKLPGIVLL